ncbi:MAG: hypothetical protein ACI3VB_09360 [Oscillospiraceae bacterium]
MKETMNKYYSYAGQEFWDMPSKETVAVVPLTTKVSQLNTELYTVKAKPESERRNQGYYNPKAFSYVYDDFLESLKSKGLTFYLSAMMDMTYVAIVPEKHMKENKFYTDDIDTLVVMVHVDITDPNYAMYTMERYADYIDEASKQGFAIHFGMYSKLDDNGRVLSTVRESLVIHRFNYKRLYLDVSGLTKAGVKIADIEGFSIPGYENPDDAIVRFHGVADAVDISDMWISKVRSRTLASRGRHHNMDFNPEQHIHSRMGRRKAEGVLFFDEFEDINDPALAKKLYDMGAVFSVEETGGEQWLAIVPRQAVEEGKKVPIIGCFSEVNAFDPAHAVGSMAGYFSYITLAAEGNFAMAMFAMEDPDSNDLMADIIMDAAKKYPIDLSRVYVTGHSHNGRFTAEFARRHQKLVAAAAPMGNEPGQLSPEWTSGYFAVSDEQLKLQASVDTPIIMQCGLNEINSMFPLYTDAPYPNPATPFIALNTAEKRVKSWQRRLISSNCPMKTEEEIYATQNSKDYVERKLGIPADKTDVLFMDDGEVYIADIKNVNGDYHLRVCGYENTPHAVTPEFADMAWSFLRRFARDQETGETIELY